MSRARDMANLGSQAGSGFDASDLTTGTLGNTVQDNITRLGTVTTGTMNNTIGDSATFNSKYVVCTKIFPFWHSTATAGIVGNNTGTEVLSTSVGNATFANSIYLFSCTIQYNIEDAANPDQCDLGMGAWLQNSDASKVYRFGFYNTGSGTGMWTQRHSNMASTVGNYWLADSDGGNLSGAYLWNQEQFSVSDVGGNRTANETQHNVASNFSAGEALTLKVRLASHHAGLNYNSAKTDGAGHTASKSFYCIKEYTQVN